MSKLGPVAKASRAVVWYSNRREWQRINEVQKFGIETMLHQEEFFVYFGNGDSQVEAGLVVRWRKPVRNNKCLVTQST